MFDGDKGRVVHDAVDSNRPSPCERYSVSTMTSKINALNTKSVSTLAKPDQPSGRRLGYADDQVAMSSICRTSAFCRPRVHHSDWNSRTRSSTWPPSSDPAFESPSNLTPVEPEESASRIVFRSPDHVEATWIMRSLPHFRRATSSSWVRRMWRFCAGVVEGEQDRQAVHAEVFRLRRRSWPSPCPPPQSPVDASPRFPVRLCQQCRRRVQPAPVDRDIR